MHLSKYFKIYPSKRDSVILFSTKNAGIVEMPKSIAKNLPDTKLTKEDKRILRDMDFFIENPEKERKEILEYIDELNELNKRLSIKLVMNLDCNLACKYCFEGKRKGRHYMTRETADDFIGFVKDKIGDGRFNEIFITFYGGEPLLSKELIIYISEKIKSMADFSLKFSFGLTTNGTLLTKEIVKTLKPFGLKRVYITIDGTKEIHDECRPFKSGRGSFGAILKNIKDVCSSIKVQLGGNFSRNNYKKFPELLDFLIYSGLTSPKTRVLGFFPVIAGRADVSLPDFHDGCSSANEPWFFNASVFLREEILRKGFRLKRIEPGWCMIDWENDILVNYDGNIYKCPCLIEMKEFCVGDLKNGIKDYRLSHNLDNWKNDECLDCSYLPLCFGGCRYMKFVRDGNMDGVDCKKPYFDATLETFIAQDIKYGLINK